MGVPGSGRKKEPKGLKILKGTFRADRENKDAPVVALGSVEPPEHLGEVAAKEYRAKAKLLSSMGIFTEADSVALSMYAEEYERWLTQKKLLESEEEVIGTLYTKKVNPRLHVVHECENKMFKFLTEFGLTPVSRQRVKVNKEEKKSEWDSFAEG